MTIQDALKDLTRRQLEDLRTQIDRELQTCTICNREGAKTYRVTRRSGKDNVSVSMLFCRPCFEKARLPESRSNPTEEE